MRNSSETECVAASARLRPTLLLNVFGRGHRNRGTQSYHTLPRWLAVAAARLRSPAVAVRRRWRRQRLRPPVVLAPSHRRSTCSLIVVFAARCRHTVCPPQPQPPVDHPRPNRRVCVRAAVKNPVRPSCARAQCLVSLESPVRRTRDNSVFSWCVCVRVHARVFTWFTSRHIQIRRRRFCSTRPVRKTGDPRKPEAVVSLAPRSTRPPPFPRHTGGYYGIDRVWCGRGTDARPSPPPPLLLCRRRRCRFAETSSSGAAADRTPAGHAGQRPRAGPGGRSSVHRVHGHGEEVVSGERRRLRGGERDPGGEPVRPMAEEARSREYQKNCFEFFFLLSSFEFIADLGFYV